MPVRQKQIFPAIVVKIEESDPEAEVFPIHSESGLDAGILERAIAEVTVQRGHLFGEIGAHNVEPAIAVVVRDTNTHAGQGNPILIQGTAGGDGNFAECAVVVVVVQEARSAVASDVNVRPAVVVKIRRDRSHPIGASRLPVLVDENH